MKKPVSNDLDLARQRILVIVILSVHLVYFAFNLFGVLLMMGYASEREISLGVSASPYVILGFTSIIAFVLFILTLVYFIRRNQKYLILASITGIGGYLVNFALALIFELETKSFSLQLNIFFSFVVPMIAVFLYRAAERGAGHI